MAASASLVAAPAITALPAAPLARNCRRVTRFLVTGESCPRSGFSETSAL
jgi:hypothetical protein